MGYTLSEVSQAENDVICFRFFSDPELPGTNPSDSELKNYKRELGKYSKEMIDAFIETNMHGEELWFEDVSSWSRDGIKHLSHAMILRLKKVLQDGGLAMPSGRMSDRKTAVWSVLSSPNYRLLPESSFYNVIPNNTQKDNDFRCLPSSSGSNGAQLVKNERSAQRNQYASLSQYEQHGTPFGTRNYGIPRAKLENSEIRKPIKNVRFLEEEDISACNDPNISYLDKSQRVENEPSGMRDLICAFGNKKKFTGDNEQNIVATITYYNTMCRMCQVNEATKLLGVPVMLDGSALDYYNNNLANSCNTFEDVSDKLIAKYTSEEQRARLLQEWQRYRMSSFMRLNQEKSLLEVFNSLSTKLSEIQRQLHPDYRKDRLLRDQLIRCVDTADISRSLKERVPTTAHDAHQRIAPLLSHEQGSASSFIPTEDSVNFHSARRFGGEAQRSLRRSFKQSAKRNQGSRKVRGCWCCGKDHYARDYHSSREIKEALYRHKKVGRIYLSINDAVQICDDMNSEGDENNFAEESSASFDENRDDMINFGLTSVNEDIERELSNKAFIHGISIDENISDVSFWADGSSFKGVLCDTGANRSSTMSLAQYQAYCKNISLRHL